MRFLTPSIVLFGSLYFVILGRRLRDWRETADVVAGASGILWAALTFGVRYFPAVASGFSSGRWILGGAEAGILITLLLTSSANPFQKSGRMRNHETEPVAVQDDLTAGGRISS
jgi:hypothetical protein